MNSDGDFLRSRHFTPLRYPGGKGRLAPFVKAILQENDLLDGVYVEPYAGGAAVALELLFHEYVSRICINDLSRPVYAFWNSVLSRTEEMLRLIRDAKLTVEEWDKQKKIFSNGELHDELQVGFSFFYLNRTNRSGILNGGIIGGRGQDGHWKIDARYNARELAARVDSIAKIGHRIDLTNEDAVEFLKRRKNEWKKNTLIYCDPPYYIKGRDLYYHFYKHSDHESVAKQVAAIDRQKWIVSYDNAPQIIAMYASFRSITYDIAYSARSASRGSEVMFFSPGLNIPPAVGAIVETGRMVA